MLNDFARGVHTAASPGNIVIAGGLAPFRDSALADQWEDWGPLTFMRLLLCLSVDLKPTCKQTSTFDVWSTHPYTSGGPTHHAFRPDDVSLGDLPEMHRVLVAAQRAHHIRTGSRGLGFWVTEFSWDSNRPDPNAVPLATLQQWVPLALYDMWRNGITHVSWFTLRDLPMSDSPYQSGLYFNGGRSPGSPKPFLANFRFPGARPPGERRVRVGTNAGRAACAGGDSDEPRTWRLADARTPVQRSLRGLPGVPRGPFGSYVRAVVAKTGDVSGRFPTAPSPIASTTRSVRPRRSSRVSC